MRIVRVFSLNNLKRCIVQHPSEMSSQTIQFSRNSVYFNIVFDTPSIRLYMLNKPLLLSHLNIKKVLGIVCIFFKGKIFSTESPYKKYQNGEKWVLKAIYQINPILTVLDENIFKPCQKKIFTDKFSLKND